MPTFPLVIQVVGDSGAGKTLVVETAVRRLRAQRRSVAVVKHSHHTPDLRGKDTGRFRAAGADFVLFASREPFLSFRGDPAGLVRLLPVDVVLVEGYSRRKFGGFRIRVGGSGEVAEAIARVLASAGARPSRRPLLVDGRPAGREPGWRFVEHWMVSKGVTEVRLGR